ncbi:hypothetical protein N7454_011060 [Penicillium verhagenii]|nr:hypothetical protein N7454_011060 [Penicillium verhagenii]
MSDDPFHSNNYPTRRRCLVKNKQSGTFLSIENGVAYGWPEHGPRQIWRLREVYAGSNDLLIYNEETKSCLQRSGSHDYVKLTTDFQSRYSHWNLTDGGDGWTVFRNVTGNNIVLDLAAGFGGAGIHIHGWPAHGGDNQKWTFIDVSS